MNTEKLLGKILALLKEIKTKEPSDCALRIDFTTGPDKFYSGGFGVKWWFTHKALHLCREISEMAVSIYPQLRDADYGSLTKTLQDILQQNAYICFSLYSNANNLFDASLVKNRQELASHLWSIILDAFSDSIRKWIVLYPLRRIRLESTFFEFDGISLLSSDDPEGWERLSSSYFGATLWDLSSGKEKGSTDQGIPLFARTESWLACEVSGTARGARDKAAINMRTILSVLYSNLFDKSDMLPLKSMSEPCDVSLQFSNVDRAHIAPIGTLLPNLVDTVTITTDIRDAVNMWYIQRASIQPHIAQRATAAAQYINYGASSDDLAQFLYFFIALDALFGERGKVEKSILNGLRHCLLGEPALEERAAKLFDLRSSLVHGESMSIAHWKDLIAYEKHFRSHPIEDITKITMKAFHHYF